jgi:carotenoid cleavage dioxygenase
MGVDRREFLKASAGLVALGGHLRPALGEDVGAGWPDNQFLKGNYAPVRDEVALDRLEVVGKLPEGLDGMYVRNGPNPQFPPKGEYHWFDGDGMLHGVLLREGRASYRNRYVQTVGWEAERKAGKALWGGLASLPNVTRLAKGEPLFKNAANTALAWHDGKLMALWEGGEPYVVRVPGLDTAGPFDFAKTLKHAFTAHPKVDPLTGEMMCFGYQPVAPYLQYSVVSREGVIVRTTPIELPRAVMMHDFAVTERHTVFLDLPATFDFKRMLRGGPFLSFEPDAPARIGVLPRMGDGASVRWFEIPACYVFHTLNAFEEGDEITLIACRMKTFPATLAMGAKAGASPQADPQTVLYRWRLDLKAGTVREEPLDDLVTEFPRVNETRLGRSTRFGYTIQGDMSGFVKYDLKTGSSTRHDHGPGRLGGEGVFVPRPGGSEEDDGWLMTYVFDQGSGTSELVVIDALAFAEPPVARVKIPARIPHGFHGIWLPDSAIAAQA